MRAYLDLDLALVSERGGAVHARVTSSPAGVAEAAFELPVTPMELARFLVATGPARTPARGISLSPSPLDLQEIGGRLNDAIFAGDIRACFQRSLTLAEQQGKGLRIRLNLSGAPDLAGVPWEYLYSHALSRFLTLSTDTPLVRFLDTPARSTPAGLDPPLRVLVMISSPSDAARLDVHREAELLRTTTADLTAAGSLELVFLESATLTGLQHAINQRFHVFHFIGHGGFDRAAGTGVLVLEREDGTSHLVSAAKLGTLLHDAKSCQLAVLNACEGAQTSGQDVFSGVGQTLIRQGLPAVVAMQSEISDRAAVAFSHEFYYVLASGRSVEEAVVEARKAIYLTYEDSEWGTPVLLRSAAEEQPFLLTRPAALPTRDQHWAAMRAAAQEAAAAGSDRVAVPLLQQLVAENPADDGATALLARVQTDARADTTRDPTHRVRPDGHADPPVQPGPQPRYRAPQPAPPAPPETLPPVGPSTPHTDPRRRRRLTTAVVLTAALVLGGVGGYALWRSVQPADSASGASPSVDQDYVVTACGEEAELPDPSPDLVSIPCALQAPVMDGDMSDWGDVPAWHASETVYANPEDAGATDFASAWYLVWTRDFLFVHVEVLDPAHTPVDPYSPSAFWEGDGVSFEFGPDPRALADTERLRPDDLHVLLGVTAERVLTAANAPGGRGTFEAAIGDLGVDTGLQFTEQGYLIEAAFPWSTLNVAAPPARGDVFGMNLNASNARVNGPTAPTDLARMVSSNAIRTAVEQNLPGFWHTVVLAGPSA
ncbi:CHAT domain-containing protein [Occultella aeris]|uniref:CHAT domain-containing protein n=1 Tax=Occultella aeris TaxID=2761496 RepID=UPI0018D411AD|nr:CHAT domain-containing protein [Occultella aeris]